MPSLFSQVFPPAPTFKPEHLSSLKGKVFIVTGAASGVGFELAKILYEAGGSVYVAARSTARCSEAIEKIRSTATTGKNAAGREVEGKLGSIVIDLADLGTVRGAVEQFLQSETRLDGLVHNAGVMTPPAGSKDKLGHDLEIGVHCLAPYLFTELLEPILLKTAESAAPFSVRIVWVVSLMASASSDGMTFARDGTPNVLPRARANYMQSKVGESWLAAEFSKRLGNKKVLSVSLHPGFLTTELQRHMPRVAQRITGTLFNPPIFGAYSELFAVLSPELKAEHNGGYLVAWGRVGEMQSGIAKGLKSKSEGGTGAAKTFMEYCDREVKQFL